MGQQLSRAARFRALMAGRVQMVGFRAFAEVRAQRHGITGYVQNLPAGQVEVVAEGDRLLLEKFLGDLRRGPSGARVDEVVVEWGTFRREFSDFAVRHGGW